MTTPRRDRLCGTALILSLIALVIAIAALAGWSPAEVAEIVPWAQSEAPAPVQPMRLELELQRGPT